MSTFNKGLVVATILMAASLPVHATFYKWVDDHGVTQYSQRPPSSGDYQSMRSPAPASDSDSPQPQPQTPPAGQDPVASPAETPPPDVQALARQRMAKRQNCQLARQRLSQLENHARLRYKAADGSVRVMSEAEKQAKLMETRRMMAEMCQ